MGSWTIGRECSRFEEKPEDHGATVKTKVTRGLSNRWLFQAVLRIGTDERGIWKSVRVESRGHQKQLYILHGTESGP
jgi:hypothetical protein